MNKEENKLKELLKTFIRDKEWLEIIAPILNEHPEILKTLSEEKKLYPIYPAQINIFRAFNLCSLDNMKVVILGEDPYHTPGVADGLAFSCKTHIPPSLKNILKEVERDIHGGLNLNIFENGDLTRWATQGVLLLNTALTVRAKEPESHIKLWEPFTIDLIKAINKRDDLKFLVFLLWGEKAKVYQKYIDMTKNTVFSAAHPSPFSVHGFHGCAHFSKTNNYLKYMHNKTIEW